MESLLSAQVWLSLPKDTRAKIANLFDITKSGSVYVVNGPTGPQVQSDGYSYQDLSVITVERMQQITGSESDNFYHLFKNIVAIVNEEAPIEEEVVAVIIEEDFVPLVEEKPKFCDYCDSRGVRHKKDCIRLTEQHETKTT